MAEIIQPEGVDMFQMDLEHIHAVLRNRSYNMESLMMRVSARPRIQVTRDMCEVFALYST
jgi:hypothetical protein